MGKVSRKGRVVLKVLIVIAFIFMLIAIEIPKGMWIEQAARENLARNRMIDMNKCEIVYMQETGKFSKDLKEVYDFVSKNTMEVTPPDIDLELLTIDSTGVRISFKDYAVVKDLRVVKKDGSALVLKEISKTAANETTYDGANELVIDLEMKDKELNLFSNKIVLKANSNIKAVAKRKTATNIYWDFLVENGKIAIENFKVLNYELLKDSTNKPIVSDVSKKVTEYLIAKGVTLNEEAKAGSKSQVVYLKGEEFLDLSSNISGYDECLREMQRVNIARYVLSDVNDKEVYLCPSTKQPYNVSFNLNAQAYVKVSFFQNSPKVKIGEEKVLKNDSLFLFNYLEAVNRKAERKVTEFVSGYESVGDSSYSSQAKKEGLYSSYFTETLKNSLDKDLITDSLQSIIAATDLTKDKDLSQENIIKQVLKPMLSPKIRKEITKDANKAIIDLVKYQFKADVIKIDEVSVKIESPINENSNFVGYKRNLLQSKSLFGVKDDSNHGYVDNGKPSWKTEK